MSKKFKMVLGNPKVTESFDSIEEMREYIYKLGYDYDIRGSNWDWNGSYLIEDGKRVGRIAMNGTVWRSFDDIESRVY